MKLRPYEILQKLGFNIKEDGLEINPNDAYLYTVVLQLIGKSINISSLSDEEIKAKFQGLSIFTEDATQRGKFIEGLNTTNNSRELIEAILYNLKKNN